MLACGTPGGDQQDQWQLPFLLRHLVGGQSLQEAIDAPAWHTLSLPGSFYPRDMEPGVLVVEDRFDDDVLAALRAYGHEVRVTDGWSLGRLCAVTPRPGDGSARRRCEPPGDAGLRVRPLAGAAAVRPSVGAVAAFGVLVRRGGRRVEVVECGPLGAVTVA